MATPVVAGAAALAIGLLKSRNAKVTPALVEELLLTSSRDLSVLHGFFKDGIVDVESLYSTIDQRFPLDGEPTPEPTTNPSPSPTPEATPITNPLSTPVPTPEASPGPCPTSAT